VQKSSADYLDLMLPFHCMIVSGRPDRRRILEDALRTAGQVVLPSADPREIAEILATSGLDYLAVDLTLPLLDVPALQRALNPQLPNPPDSLEAAERRHIALTLEFTGGNRRHAARLLGIARSTLLAKLRKYALEATP
jgi:DNA-binding NtrC family response regulator